MKDVIVKLTRVIVSFEVCIKSIKKVSQLKTPQVCFRMSFATFRLY